MFSNQTNFLISVFFLAAAGTFSLPGARAANADGSKATIVVHAAEKAADLIPHNLTGKFCEHLGANIYNGMDAQILRNPTFADYPFATGQNVDGITTFQFEREKIEAELRRQALRAGWPESEIGDLLAARGDGLACFWSRTGRREEVEISPDTGPHGGRAQRLEIKSAGNGIKQWTWLPLHRVRKFEFEVLARSPHLTSLRLALFPKGAEKPCVEALISGLSPEWRKLTGSLAIPEDLPGDVPYSLVLSADSAGTLVLGHLFLRPADHVNGADPDVIRLLKQSRLPLLRWPGGNFVSAYHWEDGVGAAEMRPTKPNYAWGGVEPNTFGTDEFITFCRAVGCEPMICINGGTGTPEEAARWIEYCNGAATTAMGARRAANGHPQPYNVRHWEAGNELWGHWQAHWTTAAGYADRYSQFSKAMRQADPTIKLYACGAPVLWGKNWNDTLIQAADSDLRSITDHPLIGGNVARSTDPLDVFRDFMLVPDILGHKWEGLRQDMLRGGLQEPRLAVTELQMFAHLGGSGAAGEPPRLTPETLVNPGTLGEALYDTLIYQTAVRLQPFVEMVTHSATVNHGGGLRKERERVYANPCHYANMMFADFAGARPVKTEVQAPAERAPLVLPDIKNAGGETTFSCIAALAALTPGQELLISIVNRGTGGAVNVSLKLDGLPTPGKARITILGGPEPWAVNTLENPEAIRPVISETVFREGSLGLTVPPFSMVQIKTSLN